VTDEELQNAIEEMDRDIKVLDALEKPLSREDKKRQRLLMMKKDALEKIKEAREKGRPDQETHHSATYGILCTYGEKHPLLMHIMKMKLRGTIF
jgi:hypothetical protein